MNNSVCSSTLSQYNGPLIPYYFLILYNCVTTFRSAVHMFYHDGGAQSIAGIPLSDDNSSKNIISMFAFWGSSQMIHSIITWAVVYKYPELTPLMLGCYVIELLFRFMIGRMKKLHTKHTPPGGPGTYIMFPLVLGMFLWSYFG